jgi:hypothetical protein
MYLFFSLSQVHHHFVLLLAVIFIDNIGMQITLITDKCYPHR